MARKGYLHCTHVHMLDLQSLTIKVLISSETHVMLRGSVGALAVRCRYGPVNTLGLYVNTLEYTELFNGLILDRVYGSWTLSSLLCTLVFKMQHHQS